MNTDNSNDMFINKIKQILDEDVHKMDENIQSKLAASRQKALEDIDLTTHSDINRFFDFEQKQPIAFVLASLIIIVSSIAIYYPDMEDNNDDDFITAGYDSVDDAAISEQELLDELAFISWLIEEDNEKNNAS